MVLLQKQDDKYVLKMHQMGTIGSGNDPLSPIIRLSNVFVRENATGESFKISII